MDNNKDNKSLIKTLKKNNKPNNNNNKVKKEESDYDDEDGDFTLIAKKKSTVKKAAVEIKKKVNKNEVAVEKKEEEVVVEKKRREKKVYDLPGQKRDPPAERDSLRIFYESLYEQRSDSDMAVFWLMESGLLPKDKAKQIFERKQKKAQMQKLGSPMKSVTTIVMKTTQSVSVKKKVQITPESTLQKKKSPDSKSVSKQSKKRKVEESDDGSDDDFVLEKRVNKKQKAA